MDLFGQEDLKVQFEKATTYMKSEAGKLDSSQLLYFYARYKQVNEGPCNIPKPGFFDFQGKQKWEVWHKLGDLDKREAMVQYITALTDYHSDWENKIDSGAVKQISGLGVGVSTMNDHDDDLADHLKTIFDWCKEGNVVQVEAFLTNRKSESVDINQTDENGMTLLHWCCDRGHTKLINMLLDHKINVNIQDIDGQTPLHYAVSCEHVDVVRCLLTHGADISLKDTDGYQALDIADNNIIKELLNR